MSRELNCVIIDDESHSIDLLADYIDLMPNLRLSKSYTDPFRALTEVTVEDNIDILFIDIDMPGMTGIDLSLVLRYRTRFLVVISAHSKYAIDAFDIHANGYLLKPISLSRFALAIEQLVNSDKSLKKEYEEEDYFFVRENPFQKYVRINLRELVAIEGLNNYVKIHTVNGIHVTYLTMRDLQEKLDGNNTFIRVQRSFIISMDYINKVEGAFILLNNNLEVPLGTTYKKNFFDFLDKRTLRSNRSISE